MKIAIDARFLGPEGAGLGKYTEKLLEHLQKADKENDYFVILRKYNFDLFNPKNPRFKKILVDARWYSLKEQTLLPKAIRKINPDLVHFLHYNIPLFWNGKFVVTIYDLTKLEFGKAASRISNPISFRLKQAFHDLVLRRVAKRSTAIIAGSKTTENKLADLLSVNRNKITTIYAGTDGLFQGNQVDKRVHSNKILDKYKIKKPYVIYVGNAFPYKNLAVVLESLKEAEKGLNFVYVSSRSDFVPGLREKAKALNLGGRFISTGYVPDKDLAVLYKQAESYVFPSLSEGFGLPGLEAMAVGCPVIASNIPVLKEIYGDAAIYFDPKKPAELAGKIELIMNDQKLKTDLISKGHEQVKKYSWEKMTRETLDLYKKIGRINK